jgi:predicted HAD superfamily Cof-like phosphohydrolase
MSDACAELYKAGEKSDERMMRARLLLEEVGELIEAMGKGEIDLATDAIADCAYVLAGTAVTFDLPYQAAFDEVHRSNMSKDAKVDHASGVKGKGVNYRKPDITAVVDRHRQ